MPDKRGENPVYKNYYTGDMDAYHEGPCCGGCIGEREDGYSGGGMYCCCYEGLTPLEQWNNPVKYPPVNGEVPDHFYKWKRASQERYVKRFNDYLNYEIIFLEDGLGTISLPKENGPKYVFNRYDR